jgi:ribosomal protein S18 acetylase RimI-like enzyme
MPRAGALAVPGEGQRRAGIVGAVTAGDLQRAVALGRGLQERTSTRVGPFRWGRALFNDDIPERYYSNVARVERSLAGVEVAELAREVDRALEGCRHRQLQIDDEADGARIAMGLAELGYTAEHSAMHALRRLPDRPGSPDLAEELSFADARPFLIEVYRRELESEEAATVERFADFRRTVQRAANGRFFARRVDGRVAGLCELYLVDGLAQVEHVDTLAEFRGRGLARSVITRAVAEARAGGADLVLIEADLDDWPRHLYLRLGFDEIGRSWSFTRPPAGATPRV